MSINQQLKEAIDRMGLTLYGAAHMAGASNDRPFKTNYENLRVLTNAVPPKTIQNLEELCEGLDLEVIIQRKQP